MMSGTDEAGEWLHDEHHIDKHTLEQIGAKLGVRDGTVANYFRKHNLLNVRFPFSVAEKEIAAFVSENIDTCIHTNTRAIITPLELDIYLPDHKLAIEYCGLYWHSTVHKPNNYHANKLKQCNDKGIRLITIFEDEWIYHSDLVKLKLLSALDRDPRPVVYARKCAITTLTSKQKEQFFEANHIQGSGPGSLTYGLIYEGNIVAAMTLIQQQDHHYILNRYATAVRVVGGSSKLLKHFQRTNMWKCLTSFADLRWSEGNLYEQTGWTSTGTVLPDYSYIVQDRRVHKFNYRRKNLPKLLGDLFDPALSETVNTTNAGLHRIYNCGLKRYEIRNLTKN